MAPEPSPSADQDVAQSGRVFRRGARPHRPWASLLVGTRHEVEYRNLDTGVWCPFCHPVVVEAIDTRKGAAGGPAQLYIVCPSLAEEATRAEEQGAVERLRAVCRTDEAVRTLLDDAARQYRAWQGDRVCAPAEIDDEISRPGTGLGGPEEADAISCLHALAASLLAVPAVGLAGDACAPAAGVCARSSTLSREAKILWEQFLPPIEKCWCRDDRCFNRDSSRRRGVIVIGGTAVRLLVADIVNHHPWGLLRETTATRLVHGAHREGPLENERRRRTTEAVSGFAAEAHEYAVDSLMLAGTHEVLDVPDGEPFLYDVGRELGLPVVLLAAAREAEFMHAGVSVDFEGQVVALTVGDRTATLTASSASGPVESWSLEWGAGRAADALAGTDPPNTRQRAQLYSEVAEAVSQVNQRFGGHYDYHRLVGVGGAIAALACVDGRAAYSRFKALHLRRISAERAAAMAEYLSSMTTSERAELPWVEPWRAPTIAAGAVIMQAVMDTLGYETLTYSRRDMLDGLLLYRM